MVCNGLGNRCPSRKKNVNLNFEIPRRRSAKVTSLALAMTTDPKRRDRCRVFRISQTHAVCRRDSGTRRSSAVGLHAILLGHQLGHKLPVTKRLRITSKYLVLLAEGEELETNLLQASQRIPASSGVLDEVFGTHRLKPASKPLPQCTANVAVGSIAAERSSPGAAFCPLLVQ
jgi:hypothetical protein